MITPKQEKYGPMDWLIVALATGLFVGMVPPRTATIATLWGIPLAIGLHALVGWVWYLPVIAVLWIVGVPLCTKAAKLLGSMDPREVTYDEFISLPVVYFLADPFNARVLIAGFILHRIFDILKPFGIRRLELIGGGLGIMSDDMLASLYAFVVMQALFYFQILP